MIPARQVIGCFANSVNVMSGNVQIMYKKTHLNTLTACVKNKENAVLHTFQ